MLPLYSAVVHGCRAGREQEVCSDVYWRRIVRERQHFSWRKLGAFSTELTSLAAFFDRPWDRPSARLTSEAAGWLLCQAGFILGILGRLPEAIRPMQAGLEASIAGGDWSEAARRASNLSEVTLTLGEVARAVVTGEESVALADRSGDLALRMINRTTLADALHQAGKREESAVFFRDAETIRAQMQPLRYPRQYSFQGYRHRDLLLGCAEPANGSGLEGVGRQYREACEEVRERAELSFARRSSGDSLLDIALDYLSLGRAYLGLALTKPAARPHFLRAEENLDQSLNKLRQAGIEHSLPSGLLARATFHRVTLDFPAAETDLLEAQEIAERGSMRLYEADAHLEWTRLHFATGDPVVARPHLDRARELVRACGYGRREREVI